MVVVLPTAFAFPVAYTALVDLIMLPLRRLLLFLAPLLILAVLLPLPFQSLLAALLLPLIKCRCFFPLVHRHLLSPLLLLGRDTVNNGQGDLISKGNESRMHYHLLPLPFLIPTKPENPCQLP